MTQNRPGLPMKKPRRQMTRAPAEVKNTPRSASYEAKAMKMAHLNQNMFAKDRVESTGRTSAGTTSSAGTELDKSCSTRLVEIGERLSRFGDQHHKSTHQALADAYKIARSLRDNPDEWLDFCRSHPQNGGRAPRYCDRENALHRAMRRMVGFSKDSKENTERSKKASLYIKALEGAFHSRLDSRAVLAQLIENGVTGLVKKARKKTSAKAAPEPKLVLADSPAGRLLARRKYVSGAHIEATIKPMGNGKTILTVLNAGPIQLPVACLPKRTL